MPVNEPERLNSVSLNVVLKGPTSSRPVTIHLDAHFHGSSIEAERPEEADSDCHEDDGDSEGAESTAKYSCTHCGSEEVRGDFDTYQVYRAEGNRLLHLRSEFTDPVVLALYCNVCGERIEVDNLEEIEFI